MRVHLPALIAAARAGKVVGFPTDTVPGLGVRPDCGAKLYALKGRAPDKPLILLGASALQLWPYVAAEALAAGQELARRYWPGQLTLVLPASELAPAAVHPRDPTSIGLRVPAAEIAREILQHSGPLATSSANRSGQPALLSLAAVAREFPELPVLAIATEPVGSARPSTVAKWTETGWEILREGAVVLEARDLGCP